MLLPVFNISHSKEAFIWSVRSITEQSYDALELIIIDDNSSDNTLELISKIAKTDDRIKVISNSRAKGISGALNCGISKASGKYIARQDADDISRYDRIEKQVKFLVENPDVVAVGCNLEIIDKSDKVIGKKISSNNPETLRRMLYKFAPIPHPAMLVRREEFRKLNYPENYPVSEDVLVFFQLVKLGKLGNVQEYLYQYRILEDSNSFKNIRRSLFYTLKGRFEGMRKYKIYPSLSGLIYTILQAFLLFLPNKALKILYYNIRIESEISRNEFLRIARYIIVGIITVLLDLLTFLILTKQFNINYALSDLINTPLILTFNYLSHKSFTFKIKKNKTKSVLQYLILIAWNQLLAIIILFFVIDILNYDAIIAKILQLILLPAVNYLILRNFVFKI